MPSRRSVIEAISDTTGNKIQVKYAPLLEKGFNIHMKGTTIAILNLWSFAILARNYLDSLSSHTLSVSKNRLELWEIETIWLETILKAQVSGPWLKLEFLGLLTRISGSSHSDLWSWVESSIPGLKFLVFSLVFRSVSSIFAPFLFLLGQILCWTNFKSGDVCFKKCQIFIFDV